MFVICRLIRQCATLHACAILSSFSSVFDWLVSASGSYFPTLLDWSHDCSDFVSGDADALAIAAFGGGEDLDSARAFVSSSCAAIVSPYVCFGRADDFSDAVTRGRGLLWCGDVASGRVDPLSAFSLAEIWALWLLFPRAVRDLPPSCVVLGACDGRRYPHGVPWSARRSLIFALSRRSLRYIGAGVWWFMFSPVFDCRFSRFWSAWWVVVGVDVAHEGRAPHYVWMCAKIAAHSHLTSDAARLYLAKHGDGLYTRRDALKRVSDFATLQALALDPHPDVAHAAREHLAERHFLASIHRHWVNTDGLGVRVPYTGHGFAD